MELKQEPLECFQTDTVVIKQESVLDASLLDIKKEIVDVPENLLLSPHLMLKNEEEFQKKPNCTFLKSKDCAIDYHEVKVITQEVPQSEYIVPKVELLTSYSDLPSLKSEEPCSSGHYKVRKQSKHDAPNKKIRKYLFPACPKSYLSSYSRLRHVNGQFWKRWLACEFCGHFYNNHNCFSHYFNHFVKTNVTLLFRCKSNKPSILKSDFLLNKCKIIGSKHYKRNLFIKNLPAYTGQKFYKCNKEFTVKQSLDNHLKINNSKKPFSCEICLKKFTQNTHEKEHFKIHAGEKSFKCKVCLKQFTYKSHFNTHLKIHTGEKPFNCKICLKQFTQNIHLKKHFKIHTGEKPFNCKICLKQFAHKSTLNYHLKIYTGEKPFKCEICSKEFSIKQSLANHLHIHTGEKPFACKVCSKSFTRKSTLNKHVKIHTGKKLFKCGICLKQFTQNAQLKDHLKIHTGEKPFKCKLCSKQFTHKSTLNNHCKTYTGEKPFKCDICSKKFTRKSILNKHLKIHPDKKII